MDNLNGMGTGACPNFFTEFGLGAKFIYLSFLWLTKPKGMGLFFGARFAVSGGGDRPPQFLIP